MQNKINELIYAWNLKRNYCQKIFKLNGRVIEEDLKYHLPNNHLVIDYGLIFEHEPFKWKLPIILKHLWNSHYNECLKLIQQLIDYEKKKLKEGGVSDEELGYVLAIKGIVHYVMRKRFKTSDTLTRKVVGGDYKDKTHFTVGGHGGD